MQKLYYSIREVAEKTGVEPHVLRFWEKEFPMLRPKRGRSGNRFYRERDIKVVLAIKALRREEKYTIQGALDRLKADPSLWENISLDAQDAPPPGSGAPPDALVAELRQMLVELKDLVSGTGGSARDA